MKILLLNWRDIHHPKAGGAEIVTLEHAKRWAGAGHNVTWLTSAYNGSTADTVSDKVHVIHRFGSLTIYCYVPLYLLLHGNKYDVIVDEIHGIPFFSPIFSKKPVIAFIHEVAGEIWDYMYPFPINYIGRLLESVFFRLYRNNYFWTDAPSTIDELIKRGIPKKSCMAIPCPITVSDRTIILKAKKLQKSDHPSFVFASRLVKMKGIEEVIKAFSFIVQQYSNARLTIIGNGEESYVRSLHSMAKDYGCEKNISFAGRVGEKEKYDLMAQAHILLHASVKEGWGLVVLEAASVGTPSVVYNVSGLRDIVHDGKTGVIVHTNSPRDMARDALALYKDKKRYEQYRANAIKWEQSIVWDKVAYESLSLIRKAIHMQV